jgi:hypothetical protein
MSSVVISLLRTRVGPTKSSVTITPSTNRYVISIRRAGLGDCIICLGAAWLFARQTGRTLIADWRRSRYASNSETNAFALCFEALPELAGVPFIGDDRVAHLCLPRPRHPGLWNDDALLANPPNHSDAAIIADRDGAVALIRARLDVAAPTVVFDACVNDGLVSVADSRTFLSDLRPVTGVPELAAAFRESRLGSGPVIGLHIRHGNGARTGHHHYWHSMDASIERCRRAVRLARERLGAPAPVLLCTDSADVELAARQVIADVVCYSKMFRSSGAGELHMWNEAHRGRGDAIVEMLLLAGCSALIRYPPGSFFSFYAAVMGNWKSPMPETVYDLQRRCDDGDPLSPAVIM